MFRSGFRLFLIILAMAFTAGTALGQEADLEVAFKPDAPVLQSDLPLTWTMVLGNLGPGATESVELVVEMVGEFEILSVEPAELCEVRTIPGGQEWICSLGALAGGDSTEVVWEIVSRNEGGTVDLAWVGTHGAEDPDLKNDQGDSTIPVVAPHDIDLQVFGEATARILALGLDEGGHRLDIRNDGPETAFDVTVTGTLPAGWTVTGVQVEGFAARVDTGGSLVTCSIDSLSPGQDGLVFITFDPGSEGWHDLTAVIDGYGEDIDPSNDRTVDSVLVLPTPDYVVNTTDDVDDGVCDDVHCSLREAIRIAGRTGPLGGGIVAFRIPGPAPRVIQPATAYESIRNAVTLDGWYQYGFSGSPLVEIDGSSSGTLTGLGLNTGSAGSTVRGLAVGGFGGSGVSMNADSLTVEGCYLGLRADGVTPLPNMRGISGGMNGSRVGGPTPWQRNVISGNTDNGVLVIGTAFGGSIIGNYIGTNASGTAAVPNAGGVSISGGGGLTIGGLDPADGNLVSGNGFPGGFGGFGIRASGTVEETIRILNNRIGCDVTGETALPNLEQGIDLQGAGPASGTPFYQVGAAGGGNVVSGNGDLGINVGSPTAQILGNIIGVTASGSASLPNGHWGLDCNAGFVRIGRPGAGNLIGPNSGVALVLSSGADACTLQANMVGVNAVGVEVGGGMTQLVGADDLLVGGSVPGEGNVFWNLKVSSGTRQVVRGNMIGVKPDGLSPFSSPPAIGLDLRGSDVQLGGSGPGEGNVIGGATSFGLMVNDGPDITIEGNRVGVGIDGTTPVPNATGIEVGSLFQSSIGGAGVGNHIAFNTTTGILVTGGSCTGVEIAENAIHDNGGDGIWLDVADEGLYGGPYSQVGIHRNAIHHNGGLGIDIGNDGANPIDPLDGDHGDNGQQNPVTISLAEVRDDSLDVTAFLTSHPDADFLVEFFVNTSCDPTLAGEGELFLGSVDLRTYPSGDGFVNTTFPFPDQSHHYLTATVTDSLDQTSEFSGCWTITGVSGVPDVPPARLEDRLLAASPNPFNPRTMLRWEQSRPARADLAVFDLRGRRVVRLSAGRQAAGRHEISWAGLDDRGRGLPSGVYLVRLTLDGHPSGAMRKIMLLK